MNFNFHLFSTVQKLVLSSAFSYVHFFCEERLSLTQFINGSGKDERMGNIQYLYASSLLQKGKKQIKSVNESLSSCYNHPSGCIFAILAIFPCTYNYLNIEDV